MMLRCNIHPLSPDGASKQYGKGYFAILRLYSPTEAALDRSWKPGDIEKIR